MVLQAVYDLPKDAAGYVTDAQITQSTQIAVTDVRDWIETLEGEGHVNLARTEVGLSASITASGRQAIRQNQPIEGSPSPQQTSKPTTTTSGSSGHRPAPQPTSPRVDEPAAGPAGTNQGAAMATKGEKHRAIRDLMLNSFTVPEVEQFLTLNGYDEVANAVSPNFGAAQFCFQVVQALDRTAVSIPNSLTTLRRNAQQR